MDSKITWIYRKLYLGVLVKQFGMTKRYSYLPWHWIAMGWPFTGGSTICFVGAPSDAEFVAMPWANYVLKVTFADIKKMPLKWIGYKIKNWSRSHLTWKVWKKRQLEARYSPVLVCPMEPSHSPCLEQRARFSWHLDKVSFGHKANLIHRVSTLL